MAMAAAVTVAAAEEAEATVEEATVAEARVADCVVRFFFLTTRFILSLERGSLPRSQ